MVQSEIAQGIRALVSGFAYKFSWSRCNAVISYQVGSRVIGSEYDDHSGLKWNTQHAFSQDVLSLKYRGIEYQETASWSQYYRSRPIYFFNAFPAHILWPDE